MLLFFIKMFLSSPSLLICLETPLNPGLQKPLYSKSISTLTLIRGHGPASRELL